MHLPCGAGITARALQQVQCRQPCPRLVAAATDRFICAAFSFWPIRFSPDAIASVAVSYLDRASIVMRRNVFG
jgi:hypothetical protein